MEPDLKKIAILAQKVYNISVVANCFVKIIQKFGRLKTLRRFLKRLKIMQIQYI